MNKKNNFNINNNNNKKNILNENIMFPKMLVIDENGNKLGILLKEKALEIADSKNLDLFLVSSNIKMPVAKILDYGKYKYEQKRQLKRSNKKLHIIENKEIRLVSNISGHDIEFKARKTRSFIERGCRVKISLKFRGREVVYIKNGYDTLDKFYNYVKDIADIELKPKLTNLFLDMYIIPKKTKTKNKVKEINNVKI